MQALDEVIAKMNVAASTLLQDPQHGFELGLDLWRLGMEYAASPDELVRAVAHPIWLIWGCLTDVIDGPKGTEPAAVAWAHDAMHRAASEWLAAADDPMLRAEYFDHWVYDECEYDRPSE